jgi:hypothetical protein
MRATVLATTLMIAVLAAAAPAPAAPKYRSTSKASPEYPGSSIAMKVKGKPRAGGVATLSVSGSNASRDDGDGLAFDYTLDVYVHDRSAWSTCAPTLREANSRVSQLPGKVEWIGLNLPVPASGPFSTTVKYETESFRRLMFCAYTTYVVDTAAVGALKHDLAAKRRSRRR